MATSFQALREKKASSAHDDKKATKIDAADDAHALGVGKAPLASDEEDLDQADTNTRNSETESADDHMVTVVKPHYTKRDDCTYSLNTEEAIRENAVITENALDDLRKIVTQHQASKVSFADGSSVKVDATTANVLLAVHGQLNGHNQTQMAARLAKNKAGFALMSKFAFKQTKLASGAPGATAQKGTVKR